MKEYCPKIVTERLVLRQINIDDAEWLFKLRSGEDYGKYTDIPRYQNIGEARDYINRILAQIDSGDCLLWAVTLVGKDEFIGSVCFWNINAQKDSAEIGYDLLPDFRGRGYMKEAVQSVIRYGFQTLGYGLIFADLHKDHAKSIRLLEANGFLKVSEGDVMARYELCG